MTHQTIQNLEHALPPISDVQSYANDNAPDILIGDNVAHTCVNGDMHFGRVIQIIRRGLFNKPDKFLVQFEDARRLCTFKSLQKFTEV